jgi:hypothetical protein
MNMTRYAKFVISVVGFWTDVVSDKVGILSLWGLSNYNSRLKAGLWDWTRQGVPRLSTLDRILGHNKNFARPLQGVLLISLAKAWHIVLFSKSRAQQFCKCRLSYLL